VVLLLALEGYAGDATGCRDDAAALLGDTEGISAYTPTPHMDTGEPLIGGDSALAFAIYDATYTEGGQSAQVRAYVQCRTLVPQRAVLAVIWIVPTELFDADLAAFEGLLAGIDTSQAEIRSGGDSQSDQGTDQTEDEDADAGADGTDEASANEDTTDQDTTDEDTGDNRGSQTDQDDEEQQATEDDNRGDENGGDGSEDRPSGRNQGGASGGSSDEATDDEESSEEGDRSSSADQEGVDGNSYVSPSFGWSITWDEDLWEVAAEQSDGENDFLLLASSGGTGTINFTSANDYEGDPDTCLEDLIDIFGSQDGIEDFEPARGVDDEPLVEVDDQEVAIYDATRVDGDEETEVRFYLECRTLVEGEAVLAIIWFVQADAYESELDAVTELLEGIEVA
jgi:hypothetical protein